MNEEVKNYTDFFSFIKKRIFKEKYEAEIKSLTKR